MKYDKVSQYLRAKVAVMDLYAIADVKFTSCVWQVLQACQKNVHVSNVQQPVSYHELSLHCSITQFTLCVDWS